MSSFWTLVKFEYKKIFSDRIAMVLLGLILVLSVLVVLLNVYGGNYYNASGQDVSKLHALKMDRDAINQNRGYVTDEVIKQTIVLAQSGFENEDNYFYNSSGKPLLKPEAQIDFLLPLNNVYRFLNRIYSQPITHVNVAQPNDFYTIYKELLREYINENQALSPIEKHKHLSMIDQIETPFYNEYAGGWLAVRNMLPLLGMLLLTGIAIAIGNIFGKEYSTKTDALILSTCFGKRKLIGAKITAAMSFAIIFSLLISLLYVGTYLFTHGLDGHNVPLQFLSGFEYSTYPITISQFVFLCLVVFFVVSISFSCFCVLVSSSLKNPVTTMATLLLTIFLPLFIPPTDNKLFTQIINCFFSPSLNHEAIFSKYFYTFGNVCFTPFTFLCILSLLICLLCIPLTYKSFSKHQIG